MNVSIGFPVKFYWSSGHFCRNFGIVQIFQNALYSKGTFLWRFIEFGRLWWNRGYRCFWIRRTQISPLNSGGSIFICTGHNICTKFWHLTLERLVIREQRRWHRVSCQILLIFGALLQKFRNSPNFSKCPYYIVRELFWSDLWNSFDNDEKGNIGVSEGAEHEPVLKIKVTPFLGALGSISARNLSITPEWWVIRAHGSFHRVPRQILLTFGALLQKFWNSPNFSKCPYYI